MVTLLRCIALAGLAAAASGCWTSATRGDEFEHRIHELEEGSAKERAQFEEQLRIAKARVVELEKVLEQATQVVTRNSADLGLEIKQLREQIALLEGEIAELRNQNTQLQTTLGSRIDQFARKAGVDIPIDPKTVPSDKTEHYFAAQKALAAGDHSMARGLFREFVKRYPDDENAGNAQYSLGKSYMEQGRHANALGELRTVLQQYSASPSADDALSDMADAFWALGSCKDAETALLAFLQKYPSSPLAKTAKAKQKEWKKPPAGHCKE